MVGITIKTIRRLKTLGRLDGDGHLFARINGMDGSARQWLGNTRHITDLEVEGVGPPYPLFGNLGVDARWQEAIQGIITDADRKNSQHFSQLSAQQRFVLTEEGCPMDDRDAPP